MEIILIGTILLLIGVCIYFYKKLDNFKKVQFNSEQVAATLELKTTELSNKQDLLYSEIEKRNQVEKQLQISQKYTKEQNDYIFSLKKSLKNRGEFITGEVLSDLKTSLLSKDLIKENEMEILDNIFIPFKQNNKVQARQIDHLILMKTGIYVIETKYWKGKIIHGVSKEKDKELSFVLDSMFPMLGEAIEQTIILQKDAGGDHKFVQYEDPIKQVRLSAAKINNLIKDKLNLNTFVYPVIFFSYPKDKDNYLINKSEIEDKKLGIFNSQEELCLSIEKDIVSGSQKLTIEEIELIKSLITL